MRDSSALLRVLVSLLELPFILGEKKSRRSELALYALPRALDSIYQIFVDYRLAFALPGHVGEVLLFCGSMGAPVHPMTQSLSILRITQRGAANAAQTSCASVR